MKKNLVIIRFGSLHPLPKEVKMLVESVLGPEEAVVSLCMPFMDMGLISIIRSECSAKEIARLYDELAAETGDTLPVVVMDLDSDAAGIGLGEVPKFRELVRAFQEKLAEQGGDQPTFKVTMTLDDLLDLANRKGGVEKLSQEERELLEKLSKDL